MKKKKLKYIWFVLFLAILTAGFYVIRIKSTDDMQQSIYEEWSKYYVVTHGKSAYVKTATDEDKTTALSEGQGYGMYIAVEAAQKGAKSKSEFSKLYRYYMDHRTAGTQLMSWKQNIKADGSIEDLSNSATDGDLYIAYSLIKAAELWPDKADTYKKQAKLLLNDILAYNYNAETKSLTVGNWAVKGTDYYDLVRTSDVLPEQFDVFYEFSKNGTWKTIKSSMLDSLEKMSDQHKTGLFPDFMWVRKSGEVKAAKANLVASKYDGDYYYNACRMPYNLARSKDKQSQKMLKKMMNFFMKQKNIYAGYKLNGKRLDAHQSASFDAPVFYAAKKLEHKYERLHQQEKKVFVDGLSSTNYYDSALTTMAVLGD
ncbi:glycosyl hydrolase family 8 [Streptococcus caviae]|uniref:glycosyl hydrolase family 8 n=1 Tax=Streptococcus sp. 'caviae' TaxID=1915004 RepID=UPI00094B85D8|nr:glycosyl hydrolase family 8 [Streptococcus sp. 'caviae']OLN82950.1 endoglucanase [Streptococcus sp. 'caviae']